jgi:hypothetical protein
MSILCHGQKMDITQAKLVCLKAHEERCGHRRGYLRPGRCLSPEPPSPGAALRKEERLGGHTNTVVIDGPTGALPLDTGFLVRGARQTQQDRRK